MDFKFFRNVILKALVLFLVLNAILIALPTASSAHQPSLYNSLVPGRERFPFGETPQQAYNFSLYDLEAMFASHEVSAPVRGDTTVRVFVLGDSSAWGTLLTNEETLTGQLNALNLQCGQKQMQFFNLGYPTISVSKDLMLLQRALQEQPDAILWLTTLEAFPLDKQLASPLAANNLKQIETLVNQFNLPLVLPAENNSLWQRTLWGRRRAIADWIRLQLYAIPYAATGIDQIYPHFTPAAWDLEADESFYQFNPPEMERNQLLYQALPAASDMLGQLPLLVVNEPIMISAGENSDVRYNYFYPRWAYDQYRQDLAQAAAQHNIALVDAWDWVDAHQFTNSAIHLTPAGELVFAQRLVGNVMQTLCRESGN